MRKRYSGDGQSLTTINVAQSQTKLVSAGIPMPMRYGKNAVKPKSFRFLSTTASEGIHFDWVWFPTINEFRLKMRPLTDDLVQALIEHAYGQLKVTYVPVTALSGDDYHYMEDVVVPGFRKRINAGEILNNPMLQEDRYYFSVPQAAQNVSAWHSIGSWYDGWPNPEWGTQWYDVTVTLKGVGLRLIPEQLPVLKKEEQTATLDAIASAYEKLQSAELNVALMVAEGNETLAYIRQLCRRIMRLIELATNRKTLAQVATKTWRRLRKLHKNYSWEAKGIAEAWLEVRYAIRPLMYDIAEAIEYFEKGNKRTGKRTTFRSRKVSEDSYDSTTTVNGATLKLTITTTTTARAGVLAERTLTSAMADFGFLNLAGVAWEKIKWSFILDWIINVSGLLYHLNPTATWNQLAGWCKTTTLMSYSGTMSVMTPDGMKSVPIVGTHRLCYRDPVSGPPLTFISVNFDTFKFIDLIALARGLRGSTTSIRL